MTRSKLPHFFIALAVFLGTSAVFVILRRPTPDPQRPSPVTKVPAPPQKVEDSPTTSTASTTPVNPAASHTAQDRGMTLADPAALVAQIAQALEAGDLNQLGHLLGKNAFHPAAVARFKTLSSSPLKLRQPGGIREMGELELNAHSRWVLEFEGAELSDHPIFLDLRKHEGKWSVEKITLPPALGEPLSQAVLMDSLSVADTFLQAVLRQNFESARKWVDPATVSDAKIAGLCILFEEGEYHLRKSKPLRSMFQREDTVGYLANVESAGGKLSAQFAMTLRKSPASAHWAISEINLDHLLADYAKRVAGGDLYYSPLVKNPSGGDTLALYFEFDEDDINLRTRRQLEIVTRILRSDPGKKITLSGHTDAVGTASYNNSLSSRRADVVRDYLIRAGVNEKQIITLAKGASQPRRPNLTETGNDNPEGRRANRRTEIYLDF